jgi:hypothetical protein
MTRIRGAALGAALLGAAGERVRHLAADAGRRGVGWPARERFSLQGRSYP